MENGAGFGRPGPGLRPSQRRALSAVQSLVERGERSAYVHLPPGAGKTRVGLEVVRALGRCALVLAPSTVVAGQWQALLAPGRRAAGVHAVGHEVLTPLSFSALETGADDEVVPVEQESEELAAQRAAALAGDPGADPLCLLHAAGRARLAALSRHGPWALVVDGCDALLAGWGPLLPALARALGEDTWVLGLASTPTALLPRRAAAGLHELFVDRVVEASLPAAVRTGEVAPFTELAYLVEPTEQERDLVLVDAEPVLTLQRQLLELPAEGRLPLLDWVYRELHGAGEREASFARLVRERPALARAGLRLVHAGRLPLPRGARLDEEHRAPLDGRDWAVLADGYATQVLESGRGDGDVELAQRVARLLPRLGWRRTPSGLAPSTAPVARLLAGSASKAQAAVTVLEAESSARGEGLRALVACAGDAAARASFVALATSAVGQSVKPVLATGSTVAMRRADLAALRAFAPRALTDRLLDRPLDGSARGDRALVELTAGAGWTARAWVPLLTDWLAAGGTQVLVGTAGLLGRGWDCPSLDVVIDLVGGPGTHEVRGRALRLDPADPAKHASCWTVVTVDDDHPHGAADYERLVRAHQQHLAAGPGDGAPGEVVAGVDHLDPQLSAFRPPGPAERAAVNARALRRAGQRDAAVAAWRVGEPFLDVEVAALRVRSERPGGLGGADLRPVVARPTSTLGAPAPVPLPLAGRTVGEAGGRRTARRSATRPDEPTTDPTVVQLAGVVLEALVAVGAVPAGARLRTWGSDGLTTVLLEPGAAPHAGAPLTTVVLEPAAAPHGSAPASAAAQLLDAATDATVPFTESLAELLAPLVDPDWVVPRFVLDPPGTAAERRRSLAARALRRPVPVAVVWHAVPSALAATPEGLEQFSRTWQRHLGTPPLPTAHGDGAAVLDLLRGEDPFGVRLARRTVWV